MDPSPAPSPAPTPISTVPTTDPSTITTDDPSMDPTNGLTDYPSVDPTNDPTVELTIEPADHPTELNTDSAGATDLTSLFSDNMLWFILGVVLLITCCMFAFCVYFVISRRKQHRLKTEQEMAATSNLKIRNGLVASIAIGEYTLPQGGLKETDVNAHYMNLPVGKDVETMRDFSKFLKYKFLATKQNKIRWTQDEVMQYLQEDVVIEFSSKDDEGNPRYDGLVVAVSGHGVKNSIVTSDLKTIDKTVIHRCVANKIPNLRHLPRIFLFDCCEGNLGLQQSMDMDEEKEAEIQIAESPKRITLGDIQDDTVWTPKIQNPDYNTVLIHAANHGFQALMQGGDKGVGSYLIYLFTDSIRRDIAKQKGDTLDDIMEEIQNKLHDKGKQQPVIVFNNHTRKLKFVISNKGWKKLF